MDRADGDHIVQCHQSGWRSRTLEEALRGDKSHFKMQRSIVDNYFGSNLRNGFAQGSVYPGESLSNRPAVLRRTDHADGTMPQFDEIVHQRVRTSEIVTKHSINLQFRKVPIDENDRHTRLQQPLDIRGAVTGRNEDQAIDTLTQ